MLKTQFFFIIHIILFLLLLTAAKPNYKTHYDAQTNSNNIIQKLTENDTVLLSCGSNYLADYVCWYKDDLLLIDSRYNETLFANRMRLWSNGSLQISQAQPDDTGDYHCELQTNATQVRRTYSVIVQYRPMVLTEPNGDIDLPMGAIFQIVCEARGVPEPSLFWRFSGKAFESQHLGNRLSLQIEVNSRNLSGPIECVASNGIGEPAVDGIHLRVLYAPEIQVAQNVIYTKVGFRTNIECMVAAQPIAKVDWFHHGVPLTYDARINRYDIVTQSNDSTVQSFAVMKYILSIKSVRDSDLGLYECRAENKFGFKSAAIDLTGRPMPCVFKINPGVQSSTSHVLVWQTESLSPLMEFKLQFRQIPSGTVTAQTLDKDVRNDWTTLTIPSELSAGPLYITTYTMHGLQPASVYEVVVFARNHFGWSESSKIVRFATGGEVELPNYSTESDNYKDDELITDVSSEISQDLREGSNEVPSIASNGLYIKHHLLLILLLLNKIL